MKRCNNCGWFNLDSAERCEKCDDESFEPVVAEVKAECEIKEEPKQQESVLPVEVPETPKKNNMMATVAFAAAEPVNPRPARSMAATVMDANAVLSATESLSCPKCRYPIIGYAEYCPNCGATIKNNAGNAAPQVSNVTKIESFESSSSSLKATVRDIPENMVAEDDDLFRLVPVDALGEATYEMRVGDILVIGGRRYKFQK